MNEEYYTTAEVAQIEGVTPVLCQRFAKKNGVYQVGKYFFWTYADLKLFQERNKKPGRPSK